MKIFHDKGVKHVVLTSLVLPDYDDLVMLASEKGTYTHMQAYRDTHQTHAHICTYTHMHIQTRIHTHPRTSTHSHRQSHTHTDTHNDGATLCIV